MAAYWAWRYSVSACLYTLSTNTIVWPNSNGINENSFDPRQISSTVSERMFFLNQAWDRLRLFEKIIREAPHIKLRNYKSIYHTVTKLGNYYILLINYTSTLLNHKTLKIYQSISQRVHSKPFSAWRVRLMSGFLFHLNLS